MRQTTSHSSVNIGGNVVDIQEQCHKAIQLNDLIGSNTTDNSEDEKERS